MFPHLKAFSKCFALLSLSCWSPVWGVEQWPGGNPSLSTLPISKRMVLSSEDAELGWRARGEVVACKDCPTLEVQPFEANDRGLSHQLKSMSRFVAFLLRAGAVQAEIPVREDGFVAVRDLALAYKQHKKNPPNLKLPALELLIVESHLFSPKERFQLALDAQNRPYLRALRGVVMPGLDSALLPALSRPVEPHSSLRDPASAPWNTRASVSALANPPSEGEKKLYVPPFRRAKAAPSTSAGSSRFDCLLEKSGASRATSRVEGVGSSSSRFDALKEMDAERRCENREMRMKRRQARKF